MQHFNSFEATYGTLGGAIIFLLWLWLSNIVLLVGAEINDVIADMRAPKSAAAAQLADPDEVDGAQEARAIAGKLAEDAHDNANVPRKGVGARPSRDPYAHS